MALVKYVPTRGCASHPHTISQMFDEFLPGFFAGSDRPDVSFRPSVDILEQEDKITLKADMPRLEKGNIKVAVEDGVLSIEGKREETRKETDKGYVRNERFTGSFSRSFTLPTWADAGNIAADYKDGVLSIAIPKAEAAKPKEIDIKIN